MPAAACLCRVISAVFIHVQKPVQMNQWYHKECVTARGRTHSRVGLGDTTAHAAQKSGRSRANAQGHRRGLDLRRSEEQDTALCRGFNPCLLPFCQVVHQNKDKHRVPME